MVSDIPFAALMSRLQQGDPEAARLIFNRFAQRLVCLAATRLPRVIAAKVDPEDVLQSVFRSFFARHFRGEILLDSWDSLWTLLAVLTVRKCGHRVDYFRARCRDVHREAVPPGDPDASDSGWQPRDDEPTAAEAVLLAETLEDLLRGLKPDHRPIVQLRLEGCTIEEISNQVGFTERTVHRVLEKVRAALEMASDLGDAAS